MASKPSNEEVTGDPDQDHHAGAPSSPSTSGGFRRFLFKGIYREDCIHSCFGLEFGVIVQDLLYGSCGLQNAQTSISLGHSENE